VQEDVQEKENGIGDKARWLAQFGRFVDGYAVKQEKDADQDPEERPCFLQAGFDFGIAGLA
jgi:hypothetical protein